MMGSINRVLIVGHLGADPELKSIASGRAVCNLRVATSYASKKPGGGKDEKTEWHRVTVWGEQAESCGKYLAKGRMVAVEGRIQTRTYEKDGQKHYATDIVADRVTFLGGGGDRADRSAPPNQQEESPSTPPSDDDIPF